MRLYQKVTFLPEDINAPFLAGRCIKILHALNMQNGLYELGLSFPGWNAKSIGYEIIFVSQNEQLLSKLTSQQYFQDMKELGYFGISRLKEVPPDVREVRFARDQSIEKALPGGMARKLKRLKKRAESRGEIFTPKANIEAVRTYGDFHSIPISSSSTGKSYNLNVVMYECEFRRDGIFSSYGLTNKSDLKTTVPIFSQF